MSDFSDDEQMAKVWSRFKPLINSLLISMENSPMVEQTKLDKILHENYPKSMTFENVSKIDRYISLAINEGLPIQRGTTEGKTFYWFNLDAETFKYLALAKDEIKKLSNKAKPNPKQITVKTEQIPPKLFQKAKIISDSDSSSLDSIEEEFEKLSLSLNSKGSSTANSAKQSVQQQNKNVVKQEFPVSQSMPKQDKFDQFIRKKMERECEQESRKEEEEKNNNKKKQDKLAKKIFDQIINLKQKPFSQDSQMCGIILALIKYSMIQQQNPNCDYPRTITFKNLFQFIEKIDSQLLTTPGNPLKSKKQVLNDLLIRGMIHGKMPIWFNIEGRLIHFKKVKNLVTRCTT